MRKITSRFVLLVATAAVAPLVGYGWVSISSLRAGTQQSVIAGNLMVATRAAEQVELYMSTSVTILRTVAADLHQTQLQRWQQDRIVKNYAIEFPQFREITVFNRAGEPIVSSRTGTPRASLPANVSASGRDVDVAPIAIDDDLLPTTTVVIRHEGVGGEAGWLVGELNLEELWRMIDRIRIGSEGFALLVASDGRLIAHGNPDEKSNVARGHRLVDHPLVTDVETGADGGPVHAEYTSESGERLLAVAASIEPFGWTVIVEQPTREAYNLATQLERQLVVVIGLALMITIGAGYFWGRSFIKPILALRGGTRAIAEGRLHERVQIGGWDEFHELGMAFNRMADRVVELQEDVRRQERQAMLGRIATSLVHDLSHPVQNIGNSCRLILKRFGDHDYRETFRRTVEREVAALKRVLDDLRHLGRPVRLEHFPVNVHRSLADTVEAIRPEAETAGLAIATRFWETPLHIEGDLLALGRVYRNLIVNAIQATAAGGAITITTRLRDGRIQIAIADTGCGIPPDRLAAVFEDFVTTKHRGLGLGLAISRQIVEQLAGTIRVTSEVGKGTTFVLDFPETSPRQSLAAAAS